MNQTENRYHRRSDHNEELRERFFKRCHHRDYRRSLNDVRSALREAYYSYCTQSLVIEARQQVVMQAALRSLRSLLPEGAGEHLRCEVEALMVAAQNYDCSIRPSLHTIRELIFGLSTAERLLSDAQEFGDRGDIDLLYSDEFAFLAHAFQIAL